MARYRPMTTFYLSGPMTGIPEFNFPLFNSVAAKLRAAGFDIRNPAEHFDGYTGHKRHKYLSLDVLTLIRECRGIILLPGWLDSDGARLEAQIALDLTFDDYALWKPERSIKSPYGLTVVELEYTDPYRVDVTLNG
jgi:Domain of unknown function (DUF4406)